MIENKDHFKKLFDEKKYFEIISLIKKESDQKKINSGLLNLSGVCKLLSGNSIENYESALNDFRDAFLKEKTSQNAINGLKNFINTAVDLFDAEFRFGKPILSEKNFDEILLYLEKNNKLFSDRDDLVEAIIRVLKRKLDIKKVIYLLETLIEKNPSNIHLRCSLIYFNSFLKGWKQSDFLENSKKLSNFLPTYSSSQLVNLNKSVNKKINLAFLSSDIRSNHSVTYFLRTILSDYNQHEFNIFLYFNNEKEDITSETFKKYASIARNISRLNDIEAINIIRKDQIDIIIDLMGITSNQRLSLFKNRLANHQITWCGYTNTSGLDNMDYIIADKNLIKENEKELYTEKIIYLDNIWNCHPGFNQNRIKYDSPLFKNKYFTFGSFNNFRKINDDVINIWSSILKKVKGSKLILKASDSASKSKILEKFKKNNIFNSVEFVPYKKSFSDHLNEYKNIDLALDTFPYNGVTTSFESIWMGVPVLTIKGFNFTSRCGESINRNINLDNLIADDENDYVNKAVNIAFDEKQIREIRNNIFKNATESPLFNKKLFSNHFFTSLKNIYN